MEKNITYTLTLPEGVDTLTVEMVAFPEGFEGIVLIPEGVRRMPTQGTVRRGGRGED